MSVGLIISGAFTVNSPLFISPTDVSRLTPELG